MTILVSEIGRLPGVDVVADAERLPDNLGRVGALAAALVAKERVVAEIEAQLSRETAELRRLRERDVPEAMDEVGLTKVTTADGSVVDVRRVVAASIPKERLQEALTWLRDNDHGDLIKRKVAVAFGRGADEEAERLVADLRNRGLHAEDNVTVHAQTLSAFCRECLEVGVLLPTDLLGVYVGRRAYVKQPDQKERRP